MILDTTRQSMLDTNSLSLEINFVQEILKAEWNRYHTTRFNDRLHCSKTDIEQ